jgi:sec-independent protein translocase protein TatA
MLRNGLEPWHLLIVAVVAIMLFGSKRLPDTARALGRSMRILKSETRAMKADEQHAVTEGAGPVPAPEPVPATPSQSAAGPGSGSS